MKRGLLGALEGYNDGSEETDFLYKKDDDQEDGDFLNAKMLEIMEDTRDLDEQADEIEEMDDIIDNADSSVERLGAISKSIEKYGICRATMEASDPDRELVSSGICCAYEDLSDVPVRDDSADKTMKRITSTIENILERIAPVVDERNLRKDMLEMATNELRIRVLSIEEMQDSFSNSNVMLHVYDKVKWHYPDGKNCPSLEAAKTHIEAVMHWLKKNDLLSEEGLGAVKDGVDAELGITDSMLTPHGNKVMKSCYRSWLKHCKYGENPSMEILDKCLEHK